MPLLPGLSVRPMPGWDGLTDSVPAPGMPVLPGLSVQPGPGLDGLIGSVIPPPRLPEPPGLPGEPIPEPLACATMEFGIG